MKYRTQESPYMRDPQPQRLRPSDGPPVAVEKKLVGVPLK